MVHSLFLSLATDSAVSESHGSDVDPLQSPPVCPLFGTVFQMHVMEILQIGSFELRVYEENVIKRKWGFNAIENARCHTSSHKGL